MDTSGGRGGDIASLRYRSVHLAAAACIHIEYLIEGDVQLDVLYNPNPPLDSRRSRLCSLGASDGVWTFADIDLPSGPYDLHLDAVLMSLDGTRVYIQQMELLSENCTKFRLTDGES